MIPVTVVLMICTIGIIAWSTIATIQDYRSTAEEYRARRTLKLTQCEIKITEGPDGARHPVEQFSPITIDTYDLKRLEIIESPLNGQPRTQIYYMPGKAMAGERVIVRESLAEIIIGEVE